jgi:hypothetical protein
MGLQNGNIYLRVMRIYFFGQREIRKSTKVL